jgi:hypothetical protein
MIAALGAVLAGLVAATMLAAWFGCAWRVALQALPEPNSGLRACAVATVGLVLGSAVFAALVAVGSLQLEAALPVWIVLAATSHVLLARDRRASPALAVLAADLAACRRRALRLATSRAGWIAVPLAVLAFACWMRASVAPPLAWDALTYHLVKAARWTQGSGLYLEDGPDAWGYYRWFAWIGDSVWAWAMVATHDDLLLGTANAVITGWVVLAALACATELGADELLAWLAAAAVALAPAVQRFWSACYVDNLLLACWLSGVAFLVRACRASDARVALLAVAAFALTAGVKLQGLPLGVLGVTATGWVVHRRRLYAGRALAWTLTACASLLVGFAHYALVAHATGSPFYPHAAPGFGSGDKEFAYVLIGTGQRAYAAFLDGLFGKRPEVAGFGPAGALVVVAGIAGAVAALREPRRRAPTLFLVACSASVVLPLLAPDVAALWNRWGDVSARFAVPAFASAVLGVLALPRRASIAVLVAAVAQDLVLALPIRRAFGWVDADAQAIASFALVVLPLLFVATFLVSRDRARHAAFAAALALVAVAVAPWERVRAHHRDAYYDEARLFRAFEGHELNAEPAPVWSALDGEPGLRVAASAGWELAYCHNAFVYPLFGARLQNRVEYVPVTRDGSIVDYRSVDELAEKANERAWIERLVARGIHAVVVLRPMTGPEPTWIAARPELFESLAEARESRAWRFRAEAARAWLAETR